MSEGLLSRFDTEHPCWTEDLLAYVKEDTDALPSLVMDGFLSCDGGIYSLTENGRKEFQRIKEEFFLDTAPGVPPSDKARSVLRTKLFLLLDNAHTQRWGIKQYKTGAELPVVPKLPDDISSLFSVENGKLLWHYPKLKAFRKMAEDFQMMDTRLRSVDTVSPFTLEKWLLENAPVCDFLTVDLLYLCRYDFMHYKDFKGHPNDTHKMINADRFLFVFSDFAIENDLITVAKFHLWLNFMRRMLIPGYVDRDTLEQDSVNWLILVKETEKDALNLAGRLSSFGKQLTEGAYPCEILTMSMQAIADVKDKREIIWELLPAIAHRTDLS